MSWDLEAVQVALAVTLSGSAELAGLAPAVWVFDAPPATFNAPALVVLYPDNVERSTAGISVDLVETPILAGVGLEDRSSMSQLIDATCRAFEADRSLGGAVQYTRIARIRDFRAMDVGGARLLTAQIALEVQA